MLNALNTELKRVIHRLMRTENPFHSMVISSHSTLLKSLRDILVFSFYLSFLWLRLSIVLVSCLASRLSFCQLFIRALSTHLLDAICSVSDLEAKYSLKSDHDLSSPDKKTASSSKPRLAASFRALAAHHVAIFFQLVMKPHTENLPFGAEFSVSSLFLSPSSRAVLMFNSESSSSFFLFFLPLSISSNLLTLLLVSIPPTLTGCGA